MRQPFFSVCIPVYNGAQYLDACLSSVAAQTFKDYEIILVDDKSTDNSCQIIQSILEKDQRIVFYRNEETLGLVGNWNKCVSLSSGKWIKFLFQDDYWSIDCLQKVYDKTESVDFIFHGRNFYFENGVDEFLVRFYQSENVSDFAPIRNKQVIDANEISKIIAKNPPFNFFGEPSNIAFSKHVVSHVGTFDDRLVQLCDYEMWARITTNYNTCYIADKLSTFRIHAKATSTSNLTTQQFRFKYLDPLIIYRKFAMDEVYKKLRAYAEPSAAVPFFSHLYKKQEGRIVKVLNEARSMERTEMFALIFKWAPFAYRSIAIKNRLRSFLKIIGYVR
jgi:glycosyltransferase involved in cell wall biosynthesis